ncbi:HlyC/CorC family transporter [Candidatus Peregrinibacteria bacterium]|nr:HlyC/CorC family transporter [Candidatus Peregrinibacteria bacterium]
MYTQLVLLIFLIILSAAFSGAEIALTSLSPAKVRAISKGGKFGSRAIVKLKSRPQRLLITILVGNNLVNILATVIATIWAIGVFGNAAIGIVTGVLTLVILIFGEITPKTFAQKYSERFACLIAHPLLWLTTLLFPVIWLFEKFTQGLISGLKLKQSLYSVSEEELLALVDIGTKEGVIEEQEQELIENVLEFSDTTVEEVMTVKKDMEVLKVDTSIHDAVHFFLNHSHSRIPVYKDSVHNMIGIVTVHDILCFLQEPDQNRTLQDFKLKHPILVPKTKSISKLFHEFQRRRRHLAIVVDERGETVGLVTMEDILEEIVGDIVDEHDQEERMIKPVGKNEWVAEGDTSIEQVNEELDVELAYPEHQTVSLLILEQLHRFPKLGEKIVFENLIFQVKEMGKKKIELVEITKLSEPEDENNE